MQKMRNRMGNFFVKPLLRSPLHFLLSGNLMLITFTGRKSGRVYTTPVQYRIDDQTVVFLTQRNRIWWKNLQDNAGVKLRLKGREIEGMVERLIFDEAEVAGELQRIHNLAAEKAADWAERMLMVRVGVGGGI